MILLAFVYAGYTCPLEWRWLFVTLLTMWMATIIFWKKNVRLHPHIGEDATTHCLTCNKMPCCHKNKDHDFRAGYPKI